MSPARGWASDEPSTVLNYMGIVAGFVVRRFVRRGWSWHLCFRDTDERSGNNRALPEPGIRAFYQD